MPLFFADWFNSELAILLTPENTQRMKVPIMKVVTVVDNVTTGAEFRSRRKAQKLRLRHVAAAVGMSISMICQLERGFKKWTPELCALFESAVGIGGKAA